MFLNTRRTVKFYYVWYNRDPQQIIFLVFSRSILRQCFFVNMTLYKLEKHSWNVCLTNAFLETFSTRMNSELYILSKILLNIYQMIKTFNFRMEINLVHIKSYFRFNLFHYFIQDTSQETKIFSCLRYHESIQKLQTMKWIYSFSSPFT